MGLRAARRAASIVTIAVAALAAFEACSTDSEPESVTGTAFEGGEPDVIDATTERKPKDVDAACPASPPDATAPAVEDELVLGDRPAATGGEVVPGTYFLSKSEIYIGDGGVGPDAAPREAGALSTTISRVVVITTEHLTYAEGEGTVDGGIDERDEHVFAYTPVGTILVLTELCPEKDPYHLEYTATPGELHLFPSATQREVLTRQGP